MPQKGVLKGLTNKVFEQHMHGCENSKKWLTGSQIVITNFVFLRKKAFLIKISIKYQKQARHCAVQLLFHRNFQRKNHKRRQKLHILMFS